MSTFLQRCRSFSPKGFTLTELMVVISIMTILTGVFLFQQRQFDSSTLLRSLTYSVALSIREAQTYGTSVLAFNNQFPAYGVYFSASSPTSYILFADVDDDGQYDVGVSELVDTYNFQGNYTLSEICATDGTELCGLDWLAITFRRPNPDACIATSDELAVCGATNTSTYSQARVQIQAASETARSVTVTPSGQISVGGVETEN